MIPYQKQILSGILLALLLSGGAMVFSGLYDNRFSSDPYADIPVVNVTSYNWDFSSGLTLSQSFSNQSDQLLQLDTHIIKVDAVTGQSDNISITCDPECENGFAWGGHSVIYYDFNVSNIRLYYNTQANNWNVNILRLLTDNNIEGNVEFHLMSLPIDNISKAFIEAIGSIEDLQQLTDQQYGELRQEHIDLGDYVYSINQAYRSGVRFDMELIDNQLFFRINYFDAYRSSDQILHYIDHEEGDDDSQYYVANLDEFFSQYTTAINEFLSSMLEG